MSHAAVLLIITGILCVLYGIMVFLIRSGTLFFGVWIVMGAGFLLLGWLTQIRFWARLPRMLRLFLLAAVIAAALLFAVCEGFVLRGFSSRAPADLDYLIVLGAQVRPDETPSSVLQYRLDAAVSYLRENPQTACIVSGGQGPNEPIAEADCMAAYLQQRGVDPARVIREDRSTNTMENIANSMALMSSPSARVGIVTVSVIVPAALAFELGSGYGTATHRREQGVPFIIAWQVPALGADAPHQGR